MDFSIIYILSRINSIYRIETYLIKIPSNTVFPYTVRLCLPRSNFPIDLPVKILKEILPPSIWTAGLVHLNLLDFITLIVSVKHK